MHTLILDLQKKIYEGEVQSLKLPGIEGSFEIMQNHAPMISFLGKGVIKLIPKKENLQELQSQKFDFTTQNLVEFSIEKGILKINQNKIIILL